VEEIRYAVDDVKYLAKVYIYLKNKLSEQQRSHWSEFECNTLSALERYKVDASKIWKSVKGAGKLEPPQLIILKQLAEWRENQAIAENKPRRWVLSDKALRSLAIEQPLNTESLQHVEDIKLEHVGYVDALFEEIAIAKNIPESEWPEANQNKPFSNEQRKLIKQAQSFIRERAEELNVSPSLLATRSVVEKLVRGGRELDILSSWKKELVGDKLVELIEAGDLR
jgi:ribonuclease D